MFQTAKDVRPVSSEVAKGLVLFAADVEPTGTLRQGRPEFRILRRLWYRDFEVPAGFVFDVHSLPRALRPWQPQNPSWWGPPALHDWALESGLVTIREANQLYRDAMADLGVKWAHRTAAYAGVEFARLAFPERITRVDPHNAELVERLAGRQAVFPERGARIRRIAFRVIKTAAAGYLRTKGIPLP